MNRAQYIGDAGESIVRAIASAAGFTVQEVSKDRLGWDQLFELESKYDAQLPFDRQPMPLRIFVQVKATTNDGRSPPVSLSVLRRIAADTSPWFFIVARGEPDDFVQRTFSFIPVNEEFVSKILERVRSEQKAGLPFDDLPDRTMSLDVPQGVTLNEAGTTLRRVVREHVGDIATYGQRKQDWYENCGFFGARYRAHFEWAPLDFTPEQSNPKSIKTFARATFEEIRFGIPLPYLPEGYQSDRPGFIEMVRLEAGAVTATLERHDLERRTVRLRLETGNLMDGHRRLTIRNELMAIELVDDNVSRVELLSPADAVAYDDLVTTGRFVEMLLDNRAELVLSIDSERHGLIVKTPLPNPIHEGIWKDVATTLRRLGDIGFHRGFFVSSDSAFISELWDARLSLTLENSFLRTNEEVTMHVSSGDALPEDGRVSVPLVTVIPLIDRALYSIWVLTGPAHEYEEPRGVRRIRVSAVPHLIKRTWRELVTGAEDMMSAICDEALELARERTAPDGVVINPFRRPSSSAAHTS